MKSTLSTLILICTIFYVSATVRIVDNNGNRPAGGLVYSTFIAANNAAVAGDTLLVIPSTNSYGFERITVSGITVIGTGFNPDKDIPMVSSFNSIDIDNNISDVTISGIVVTGPISLGRTISSATHSNIIIEKSRIGYIRHSSNTSNLSNIIIRQNYFDIPSGLHAIEFRSNSQSNIFVSNNIFSFSTATSRGPYVSTGGVTFDHNIFVGTPGGLSSFHQLVNCTVSNNIFYGKSINTTTIASSGLIISNNLVFGNADNSIISTNNTLVGNLTPADPQFVEMSSPTSFDFSKDLALEAGSPAENAGTDGTDLGIYGGSSPYKNSGVSLPVVKSITIPTTIKQGTNTNANISVNGN